jgi:hypothetical protein
MQPRTRIALAALLGIALAAGSVRAADNEGLKKGTPDIKSAGPLAFGPDGILFIGDPQGAALFAIDTGDNKAGNGPIKVEGIDGKVAGLLGVTEKEIELVGMAVNPTSGTAYLSVSRGKGPDAAAVILRANREGNIEEFALKDVKFAKAELSNPAQDRSRKESITHLAYVDGRVFVSGLSNEEFSSNLRAIPYPFKKVDEGASVEIFHGSHGRLETKSPIRTFAAFSINGQDHILAAYTCTPLVKIPVSELKPGAHIKGTTIAELGNRNRPLDMIVYQKGGKDYILMANNSRGLMKISTENIDKVDPVTSPVKDKAGLTYETINGMKGVQHLDRLDKEHALVLLKTDSGTLNLETIDLP